MSEELIKRLDAAMARIAALESERANRPAPQSAQGIDPQALIRDPIGTLQRAGLPVDHFQAVMVANAMGDQAPPQLRALAAMGPQVSATQALASDLQAVRQRLEQLDTRAQKDALRTSFSALAGDKVKYPALAAAFAKNPSLFDDDVNSWQGEPAALAQALDGRTKRYNEALGITPPASSGNAETAQGQSTQAKQAQGGQVDTTPPPIPAPSKPGVFTTETHEQLKARILQQFAPHELQS